MEPSPDLTSNGEDVKEGQQPQCVPLQIQQNALYTKGH